MEDRREQEEAAAEEVSREQREREEWAAKQEANCRCDWCGVPLLHVEGEGHEGYVEQVSVHIAVGNQTVYEPFSVDEDVDWDMSCEYDLCDDCTSAFWAAWEKARDARRGARKGATK